MASLSCEVRRIPGWGALSLILRCLTWRLSPHRFIRQSCQARALVNKMFDCEVKLASLGFGGESYPGLSLSTTKTVIGCNCYSGNVGRNSNTLTSSANKIWPAHTLSTHTPFRDANSWCGGECCAVTVEILFTAGCQCVRICRSGCVWLTFDRCLHQGWWVSVYRCVCWQLPVLISKGLPEEARLYLHHYIHSAQVNIV